MIEPPIDERYERAAEVMAAIAERDEAVAKAERLSRAHGAVVRSYAEAVALLKDAQYLLGDGPACDDFHIKLRAFLAKLEAKP